MFYENVNSYPTNLSLSILKVIKVEIPFLLFPLCDKENSPMLP